MKKIRSVIDMLKAKLKLMEESVFQSSHMSKIKDELAAMHPASGMDVILAQSVISSRSVLRRRRITGAGRGSDNV